MILSAIFVIRDTDSTRGGQVCGIWEVDVSYVKFAIPKFGVKKDLGQIFGRVI